MNGLNPSEINGAPICHRRYRRAAVRCGITSECSHRARFRNGPNRTRLIAIFGLFMPRSAAIPASNIAAGFLVIIKVVVGIVFD
jgi:hypothetical protein